MILITLPLIGFGGGVVYFNADYLFTNPNFETVYNDCCGSGNYLTIPESVCGSLTLISINSASNEVLVTHASKHGCGNIQHSNGRLSFSLFHTFVDHQFIDIII